MCVKTNVENVNKSYLVLNYTISAINCAAFSVQTVSRQTDRWIYEVMLRTQRKKSLPKEIKSMGRISHMDVRQAVLYLQCFPKTDHVVFVQKLTRLRCMMFVWMNCNRCMTVWERPGMRECWVFPN